MAAHTDDLTNMMCLDVFLMSLNQLELNSLEDRIKPPRRKLHPLKGWDISSKFYIDGVKKARRDMDVMALLQLSKNIDWDIDFAQLLMQPYQALVVTNKSQQIMWVNKGFSDMTGYATNYSVGKRPSFLQGQNTCASTRKKMASYLNNGLGCSEKVVNYRKNGEEYRCQIQVVALKNSKGETTHFIALENEIA